MKTRAFLTTFAALCLAHTASAATWINALAASDQNSGNWNIGANWQGGSVPTWGADLTVDFSTLDITANRSLNVGGTTSKIVGKIIFGDTTSPNFQWDIVALNGPLTLSTTLPLPSPAKPVIEVVNSTSVITVTLAGTQGFEKTGGGTLRLNNQNNGITGEILVSQGVLQIRDGSSNTPIVFASGSMDQRSIRVTGTGTGTGTLDLFRIGTTGTQGITWTMPGITLENGGTLRFRNDVTATYNHAMDAAVIVGTGGGKIVNSGTTDTGTQNVTLSGALSGSGALEYLANSGTTRRLTVSKADNSYSGDWSVSHSGTGTALLRAGAANALGTGTVTLNARATLENNIANGLDSLAGVKLTASTSTLTLGATPWTNAAAILTAQNGTIHSGSGASTIGTFLLDSAGTVTLDADPGGSLAATSFDIRQGTLAGTGSLTGTGTLTKSTSGTATLAGTHSYTGATTVAAGALLVTGTLGATDVTVDAGAAIGGSGSIGGSLHFNAGSNLLFSLTDTLTVNGASVDFDAFSIANLTGFDNTVPNGTYTLIDGTATIVLTNVVNFGLANAQPLDGGRSAYFDSGSLQLVVIPEPSVALLGGLGLFVLLRRRR